MALDRWIDDKNFSIQIDFDYFLECSTWINGEKVGCSVKFHELDSKFLFKKLEMDSIVVELNIELKYNINKRTHANYTSWMKFMQNSSSLPRFSHQRHL